MTGDLWRAGGARGSDDWSGVVVDARLEDRCFVPGVSSDEEPGAWPADDG